MILQRIKSIAVVVTCMLLTLVSHGKTIVPVTFVLTYGAQPLQLAEPNYTPKNEKPGIHTFRCYISAIQLYQGDKLQWSEPASYHLLDAAQPGSLQVALNPPGLLQYNSIKFRLGIDSITNVSGAMGGDLDPAKGMYWTWQSGYINFKLEGKSLDCPTRNNEFQFHLGGYAAPFASLQTVQLQTYGTDAITILADVGRFLSGIDLATQNSIMIPGAEAVLLSRKAASIFSVKK